VSTLRYIRDNWDTLGPEVRTHIAIVLVTMAVAGVVGLLMGVVAARSRWFAAASLAVTSTIITVPSFALFGLLTIWLGLGNAPVICGLILYALLPILRNTLTGLRAVDPAVVEAARGMGMGHAQVLLRVELPLALPVIVAGLRQATVMVVAIATVGAAVSSDNLGRPILAAVGRTEGSYERLLSGVLPVAAIGILADLGLAALQRAISRGRITASAAT
jgi:osmoprotectant transport system permease protein